MKTIETVKLKTGRNLQTVTQSPRQFRRLKWDELVTTGDYIVNEDRRFEPWEGPNGFRADAFLKPIYRRKKR